MTQGSLECLDEMKGLMFYMGFCTTVKKLRAGKKASFFLLDCKSGDDGMGLK